MPDTQTMTTILNSYGASNLLGAGGGFNWWNIIGGFIFGIVGWYAFIHGKKEKSIRPMVIGIVLMVYPYFVSNTLLMIIIGLGLSAALYYWRE